eukprot:TRINITY_DN825_c1_g1_i1.p1 TRINITY_DN825_c1_g1~~TRINITY_DN825_c1_g1_i1.p1  ORF type:complete len:475 (-),score=73.23 TRINITY_DN825_c1_g1_i1:19-1443(-)
MKKINKKDIGVVIKCAIITRLFVFIIPLILSILHIHDYDTSASLSTTTTSSSLDKIIVFLLGRFERWDAIYYLRIAEYGYEYEQNFAFFPIYPIFMRLLSSGIIMVIGEENLRMRAALILSGFIISNICFIFAAVELYRLTKEIMKNEEYALITSILFCITPGGIFMSSIYTESLFAMCTIKGLRYLATSNHILASLLFSCATGTRSNGLLLCGFLVYSFFQSFFQKIFFSVVYLFIRHNKEIKRNLAPTRSKIEINLPNPIKRMIFLIVECIVVATPYIAFQSYGYFLFCHSLQRTKRPWCDATIPSMYGFVQAEYWNQGFLKYWEVKQIPNFILAAPIIILSFCGIYSYFSSLLFNPSPASSTSTSTSTSASTSTSNHKNDEKISNMQTPSRYHQLILLEYCLHWTFLTIFGILCMHVQVMTRFISVSTPAIYWFCAHLIYSHHRLRRWVISYFIFFTILGSVLFCTFYPWT